MARPTTSSQRKAISRHGIFLKNINQNAEIKMIDTNNNILPTLETQLAHRLEKLWRVFSWCSSISISITAGVIAISAAKDFHITDTGRVLVSAVIIIVTVYAWAWIQENLQFEKNIRDQIDKIFEEELNYPQLKKLRPDRARFGYKDVILLLGIVALAATWVDFLII